MELDNYALRDGLRQRGLDIDGVHIEFLGLQRSIEPHWKVYVTQLPGGITKDQIFSAFREFGDIREIQVITKVLFGKRFDTGDRSVIFKNLAKDIPSYVRVRRWIAYVKYDGQPKTCRVCGQLDHLAKDCPSNLRKKPQQNQNKDDEMPHVPEPDLTDEEITSTPSMQEEEPHVFRNASLQKEQEKPQVSLQKEEEEPNVLSNVTIQDCSATPTVENVTVLDCYTTSPTVENVSDETEVTTQKKSWADNSDPDDQSTGVTKEKLGFKSYCPRCRVDSHSEAECWHTVVKRASKRKLPVRVSKPGKGVTKPKRFRSFKRFMQDLSLVVCKGRTLIIFSIS